MTRDASSPFAASVDAPTAAIPLADEAATAALGALLAPLCRPGDVIALVGDLGAGKTALARGLIRALLGETADVPSPTFTLVQTYSAPSSASPGLTLWHFDLYRIEDPRESLELGLEEAADGVALIEWPERAGRFLPHSRLDILLQFAHPGRIAHLRDFSDWSERLGVDWRQLP